MSPEAARCGGLHGRVTAEQRARLQAAFPDGVCDWSAPPAHYKKHSIPWLTYDAGPGGTPLGHAPKSQPGPPEH